MNSTASSLLLALALSSAGAYAADDIYRSVMPDGSVRYGESPVPGAKTVKKVPPVAASGVTIVTPGERDRTFAPPQAGGVGVIPQPERPATPPAEQGLIQSPTTLPSRAY
jgi:hypothetical protein